MSKLSCTFSTTSPRFEAVLQIFDTLKCLELDDAQELTRARIQGNGNKDHWKIELGSSRYAGCVNVISERAIVVIIDDTTQKFGSVRAAQSWLVKKFI